MAHQRTTIRNALAALLTDTTAAEDRVHKNYTENLDALPAIVIRDGEELPKPRDQRSRQYIRTWEVKIEITVEQNTGYDEKLDDIALEIETLINNDIQIGGTANGGGAIYSGCSPVYDENGQKIIGKLSMTYQIQYIY